MFLYEVDCLVFEIDKRSGQPRNAWQVLSLKIIDVFFLFWKFYSPSLFEGGGWLVISKDDYVFIFFSWYGCCILQINKSINNFKLRNQIMSSMIHLSWDPIGQFVVCHIKLVQSRFEDETYRLNWIKLYTYMHVGPWHKLVPIIRIKIEPIKLYHLYWWHKILQFNWATWPWTSIK